MTACDANEQSRHVPSLSHVAYRRRLDHSVDGWHVHSHQLEIPR